MTKVQYEHRPHLCMSCGYLFDHLTPTSWKEKWERAPCPKCSRSSIPMGIHTMIQTFQCLVKENARLRMDIFDLQSAEEDRNGDSTA